MSYTVTASLISPTDLHKAIEDAGISTSGIIYTPSGNNNLTILGTFTSAQETTIDGLISDLQSSSLVKDKKSEMIEGLTGGRTAGFIYDSITFSLEASERLAYISAKELGTFPYAIIGINGTKTFLNSTDLNAFVDAALFVDKNIVQRYVDKILIIEAATQDSQLQGVEFYDRDIETSADSIFTVSSGIPSPTYVWKENDITIAGETASSYTLNRSIAGTYIISVVVDSGDPTYYGLPYTHSWVVKVSRRG